jgi:hypothetical protein
MGVLLVVLVVCVCSVSRYSSRTSSLPSAMRERCISCLGSLKDRKKGLHDNRANHSQFVFRWTCKLGGRLDMGLSPDLVDSNHPCPRSRVPEPKVHPAIRRCRDAPPENCIRSRGGCNESSGNNSARDRNRYLGHGLLLHRHYAKLQECDALFSRRDDNLWT